VRCNVDLGCGGGWSLLGDGSLKLLKPAAIASNRLTPAANVKPATATLAPRQMEKQ